MKNNLYVIAHNIRSAYNIGAILRTADGAGVRKVYLTGYSPIPFQEKEDVYPTQAQKMISKTALGAEKFVRWERFEDVENVIAKLKKNKVKIIALENNCKSTDYKKAKYDFPCAIILGEEVGGITPKLLKKCDWVVSIPMRGKKESLNVSVAAGIAIYGILK